MHIGRGGTSVVVVVVIVVISRVVIFHQTSVTFPIVPFSTAVLLPSTRVPFRSRLLRFKVSTADVVLVSSLPASVEASVMSALSVVLGSLYDVLKTCVVLGTSVVCTSSET